MQITANGALEKAAGTVGEKVNHRGFPGAATGMIVSAILVAGILLQASCSSPGEGVIVSPSQAYSAFLGIQRLPEGYGVWVVNITGDEDEVLLCEVMPDHPASLMAYIAWDDEERLWWYGSDDGSVFYWELVDTVWERYSYSSEGHGGPVPPSGLSTSGNRTRSGR